jgi:hypothetical protein
MAALVVALVVVPMAELDGGANASAVGKAGARGEGGDGGDRDAFLSQRRELGGNEGGVR